jgi:hypothetical protein
MSLADADEKRRNVSIQIAGWRELQQELLVIEYGLGQQQTLLAPVRGKERRDRVCVGCHDIY